MKTNIVHVSFGVPILNWERGHTYLHSKPNILLLSLTVVSLLAKALPNIASPS